MSKRRKIVQHKKGTTNRKATSFNRWFLTPKMIILMLLIAVLGVTIYAVQKPQVLTGEAKAKDQCSKDYYRIFGFYSSGDINVFCVKDPNPTIISTNAVGEQDRKTCFNVQNKSVMFSELMKCKGKTLSFYQSVADPIWIIYTQNNTKVKIKIPKKIDSQVYLPDFITNLGWSNSANPQGLLPTPILRPNTVSLNVPGNGMFGKAVLVTVSTNAKKNGNELYRYSVDCDTKNVARSSSGKPMFGVLAPYFGHETSHTFTCFYPLTSSAYKKDFRPANPTRFDVHGGVEIWKSGSTKKLRDVNFNYGKVNVWKNMPSPTVPSGK